MCDPTGVPAQAGRLCHPVLTQPVFLEFAVQRALADAQELGRVLAVAGGQPQGLADGSLLELLKARAREAAGLARGGGEVTLVAVLVALDVLGDVAGFEDG